MRIKQVTFSGIDETANIKDLQKIQEENNFVEYGILLSKKRMGQETRYPSLSWIENLQHLNLSGHLCGEWARNFDRMNFSTIWRKFDRIQFNIKTFDNLDELIEKLFQDCGKQYIFSVSDFNSEIIRKIRQKGLDAVPFYDMSGGRGVLSENYPEPIDYYCGFAGGLGPDNLENELNKIKQVCKNKTIWIDMESSIRNSDDKIDVEKIKTCIEIVKNFM